MRPFIAGLALAAITVLAAVPAAAQNPPPQGRRPPAVGERRGPADPQRAGTPRRPGNRAVLNRLRRFDTNHDRQISREEFGAPVARFDQLDRNKDGVISRADGPRPERGR